MIRQFLRSFNEVRRLIRRRPSSEEVIKVCPICLRRTLEIQPNRFLPFLTPSSYHCRHCNYLGPIFAEIEINEWKKLDLEVEQVPP